MSQNPVKSSTVSYFVSVRDKIRRDEEQNKTTKDADQNVSSGGSYYEACGDDGEFTTDILFITVTNKSSHRMAINDDAESGRN